ncbi:alkane 1-monooxygenase [Aquabacterium parvum]|jgi:alkane 1-monooxygenase|uniref:alkane 1-monooxygenase n=1 Tax=Aquabacterium parvum TaxID=70584 RepID=UPI000718FFB9|nr:alkane 1-monooxygenase [Aquabacterium parvum]MBU0917829.1 alkane 1-monooxygenase [Gammaproteobacteria bacterium]
MSKYLKGWLMPALGAFFFLTLLQGGWWMWAPFAAAIVFFIGADALLPRDLSEPPRMQFAALLNLPLYLMLPLLALLNFTVLWMFGSGDFLGYGAWMKEHAGLDLFAGREATTHWVQWAGCVITVGLMNAVGGTVTGHELTHRTGNAFDLFMGRWMLAFTCDTSFAIEHVYGHHVQVGTEADPATARRGESFYKFTVRSTIMSYVHAYQVERARLKKIGKSVWNPFASPFLRGNLENIALFVAAYAIAGWPGVGFWALIAFVGKQYLEITNYFEHYGLVRVPGEPVQPRHSWNSNHWASTNVLFSLARHSHHHAEGEAPYWTLSAYPNAPMLPNGYLSMLLIALVPPLFKKMMTPALNEWDERHASPAERKLAKQASQQSGMSGLKIAQAKLS